MMNKTGKKIGVLLVSDTPAMLALLEEILSSAKDIDIKGKISSNNDNNVLNHVDRHKPDVICIDVNMHRISASELTRQIMTYHSRPILGVSQLSVGKEDTGNAFAVLEEGALDIVRIPSVGKAGTDSAAAREILTKTRVFSGVVVFTKHKPGLKAVVEKKASGAGRSDIVTPGIIVIGASTGGAVAIASILSSLPNNFLIPIICIQHISRGFTEGLASWLSGQCNLKIGVAMNGESPRPGRVYLPPDDQHLTFNSMGNMVYSQAGPDGGHRPSISKTFSSAAKYYGESAVGVLLTGMGRDGVAGMKAILTAGGFTIAQNEDSSIIFGMPKEAIAAGAAMKVLSLDKIAQKLVNLQKGWMRERI